MLFDAFYRDARIGEARAAGAEKHRALAGLRAAVSDRLHVHLARVNVPLFARLHGPDRLGDADAPHVTASFSVDSCHNLLYLYCSNNQTVPQRYRNFPKLAKVSGILLMKIVVT